MLEIRSKLNRRTGASNANNGGIFVLGKAKTQKKAAGEPNKNRERYAETAKPSICSFVFIECAEMNEIMHRQQKKDLQRKRVYSDGKSV